VENVYGFRWVASITLGSLVLLICTCYVVGMLVACCADKNALPTERSSASNCGGILLMRYLFFGLLEKVNSPKMW